MKNNQKKSKKRKQEQNDNMNKKETQKGSAKPGFCNRGFGETNEAEPLKLQGKCCFWGILNHTNTNKQEQNPENQTKTSVSRATAATTIIARTTTTRKNNNQR